MVHAVCRRFRLRRNAILRFYVDFDCVGSRKVWVVEYAISKASFYRVFVYVFGYELHFAWPAQESVTLNVSLRGRCKESGTLSKSWQAQFSWTLPKCWQACVIRRITFSVAGAGNPHHGSYVLRSKGSIPDRGCIFGT